MSYEQNPINTALLPEFQQYTDQYGMVTDNTQQNSTGNGNLYTGHYAAGLAAKGLLTDAEKARIIQVWMNNYATPGLVKRTPVSEDYNAQDDLLGIMGGEAMMTPDKSQRVVTQAILAYGKAVRANDVDSSDPTHTWNKWALLALKLLLIPRKYVWNTKNPGLFDTSAWLGRRLDVIATMKLATDSFIGPIDWIYWAIFMLSLKAGDDNDSFILRWHMALAAQGDKCWLTNWVCNKVHAKIAANFADIGTLVGTYFQNPNHPLVNLLKDIK